MSEIGSVLPRPMSVVKAVCWGVLPFIGLSFLFGKLALGLSVVGGAALSLSVGMMLLFLVGKLFGQFASQQDSTMAKIQFAAFMVAKFLITALLCVGLLAIKWVAVLGVLVGLLVGQTAIVFTAVRSTKASNH